MLLIEPNELRSAFPRFADFQPLGSGGFGAVYAVWDSGRYVALKIMVDTGHGFAVRFEREYSILKNSPHLRLVSVYESGRCRISLRDGRLVDCCWYTMEKCQASVAQEMKFLPVDRRIKVVIQMFEGLAFLHAIGVVHRDIKPQNVFLRNGDVKVGDFGLAKDVSLSGLVSCASPTPADVIVGTYAYLAPECWPLPPNNSSARDWKLADQYAAGVALFEILSRGDLPHKAQRREALAYYQAHTSGVVLPLRIPEHQSRRFPELDRVIGRMLNVDPDERFGDWGSASGQLLAALAHSGLYCG